MNPWSSVLERLSAEYDRGTFNTWLKPISYAGCEGNTVQLRVPNAHFKAWIEEHYSDRIRTTLKAHTDYSDISFVFGESDEPSPQPQMKQPPASRPPDDSGLNVRYTFETFVVGTSNQFAHAAAMAVAKAPGNSYNPLFIYGGVGLGKTHLLNAIGNHIHQHHRDMNIFLLSSESFMNEVISAIQKNRVPEFRKKFRSADVLLIDDIQYIAGKGRTTEEFFFTFNHLHERRKQIVLSSDAPPKEIGLEERVHSRFEWGLMADIRPPDIETKIAILKRKAALERVALSDDIAIFIASKISSNIRELEGALIRLAAYSSLKGSEISISLAKEALRDIVNVEERVITIELIQKVVAEEYGLKITELKSKNNERRITFPRQVAMYLAKTLTECSLPDIGKAFGGKHHSTVIHSIGKIESILKTDPEFSKRINSIKERFR